MSYMNILKISNEIKTINTKIDKLTNDVEKVNEVLLKNNEIINDLNDIKMNKLECISGLETVKSDFKRLHEKLNQVNSNVIGFINRDINYIEKNTKVLEDLLKDNNFSNNNINILIYLCNCMTPQDVLLLKSEELTTFGFTTDEISKLHQCCKNKIEELN